MPFNALQPFLPLGTGSSRRRFARPQRFPLARSPFRGQRSQPWRFASQPASLPARSAFSLCYRFRFAPVAAASSRQARCKLAGWLAGLRLPLPLPFGAFTPLWIDAFNEICRPSVRLPTPPDSLSLPAAVCLLLARVCYGSTLLGRYVSGGSLFPGSG